MKSHQPTSRTEVFIDSSIEYLFFRPPWRLICTACFFVFFLMIHDSNQTAFAQTQWKGRYVETALLDQVNPQIATPSKTDYTVIVWEDRRNGTSDIYAQMIENNTGLAMWEPIDGVPVCTAVGAQINPRAAYDSLGGVIIVWEDYRDRHDAQISDTTVMDIFAHRIILSNGQLDANWSSNPDGVPVCVRTGQRARGPRIVGTTDGAYITWTDFRNSSGEPLYQNRDVYVQYLLSATGTYPGGYNWASNGIAVTANDDNQQNPDITLDYSVDTQLDRYGVFIAYEDNQTGGVFYINAVRILADGTSPWSPVCLDCNGPEQLHPCIAPLGVSGRPFRGAVVAWEAWPNTMGNLSDVFARNIKLDGQLDWSNVVCDAAGEQIRPRIAVTSNPSQNSATVVIVFEDTRDLATSGVDVYCNALNGVTGDPSWTTSAAGLLCNEVGDQLTPEIDFLDDFVVAWEDWRTGDADIYGNLLYVQDPTQYRWPGTGQAISLGKHGQLKPKVSGEVIVWQDGRRQPITAWQNDQRADSNIYAQKLGDECDLPTEMNWHEVFVKWSWGSDIREHRFVVDHLGSMYAVWIENRPQDGGQDAVYVQKLDRDGVPKWYNGGVMLSGAQVNCSLPDVCIDSSDGCYVTWNENGTVVQLAHVDYSGVVTAMTQDLPGGDGPRIVEDDAGGVILAYNDNTSANPGIQLRHYDGGLTSLNASRGGLGFGPWYGVKLSKDRVGGAWFVWHDGVDYIGSAYNGAAVLLPMKISATVPIFVASTGEFDIDTDYIPVFQANWHNVRQYDCVVTAIVNFGGADEVIVARLFESTNLGSRAYFSGGKLVSANPFRTTPSGTAHVSSHPAISADSLAIAAADPDDPSSGGAIIAWADEYTVPGTADRRFAVLTERVKWSVSGLNAFTGSVHFVQTNPPQVEPLLDYSLDVAPTPDIATVFNSEGTDARFGIVSWTSDRYSGCTGPYAVRVQQVDYTIPNDPPTSQPKFWGTNGQDIGPIVGSIAQSGALLKSPWPGSNISSPKSIPALWMDTRSGSFCLLATRVYDEGFTRMWNKDAPEVQATMDQQPYSLLPAYPHPLSLSHHTALTLTFRAASEGRVRVSLFDVLGRSISAPMSYQARAGENNVVLELGRIPMLTPGLYLYTIEGAGSAVTRPLVVVR
jgi:hypothetical protein